MCFVPRKATLPRRHDGMYESTGMGELLPQLGHDTHISLIGTSFYIPVSGAGLRAEAVNLNSDFARETAHNQ